MSRSINREPSLDSEAPDPSSSPDNTNNLEAHIEDVYQGQGLDRAAKTRNNHPGGTATTLTALGTKTLSHSEHNQDAFDLELFPSSKDFEISAYGHTIDQSKDANMKSIQNLNNNGSTLEPGELEYTKEQSAQMKHIAQMLRQTDDAIVRKYHHH